MKREPAISPAEARKRTILNLVLGIVSAGSGVAFVLFQLKIAFSFGSFMGEAVSTYSQTKGAVAQFALCASYAVILGGAIGFSRMARTRERPGGQFWMRLTLQGWINFWWFNLPIIALWLIWLAAWDPLLNVISSIGVIGVVVTAARKTSMLRESKCPT